MAAVTRRPALALDALEWVAEAARLERENRELRRMITALVFRLAEHEELSEPRAGPDRSAVAVTAGRVYDADDHEPFETAAVSDAEQVAIQDETIEEFAAHDEPGADPLLGGPDDVVVPENGDVMCYGDGGAGKTTLMVDLACHLAAGDAWLGIPVARKLRVLLIENEGPRPLYRSKLRRKLAAWEGSRSTAASEWSAPHGRRSASPSPTTRPRSLISSIAARSTW